MRLRDFFFILIAFSAFSPPGYGQITLVKIKQDTTYKFNKKEVKLVKDSFYVSIGPGIVLLGKDTLQVDRGGYSKVKIPALEKLFSDLVAKRTGLTYSDSAFVALQNELKNSKEMQILLWIALIIVLAILALMKYFPGILSKKDAGNIPDKVGANDAEMEALKQDLILFKTQLKTLDEEYLNLKTKYDQQETELNQIRPNVFYRFKDYEKFTAPAEICLTELYNAENLVLNTLEKLNLSEDGKGMAGLASQVLANHTRRIHENGRLISKWDEIIDILKRREGAIFDIALFKDLENKTTEEGKLEEIKKNFFRDAFLKRCSSILIVLEEFRILISMSRIKVVASNVFSDAIGKILKSVNSSFNTEINYVSLADPYSNYNFLKSTNAPMNSYLQPLEEGAKPGTILQVLSYGAKSENIELHPNDQETYVIIK